MSRGTPELVRPRHVSSRHEHPPVLRSFPKVPACWPFSAKQTSEGQRLSCPARGDFTGHVVRGIRGWENARACSRGPWSAIPGRLPRTGEPCPRSGAAGGQGAPGSRTAEQRPLGAARSRQRLMQLGKIRATNPSDDGCTRRNATRRPTAESGHWKAAKWEEQSRSKTRTYRILATRPP